MAYAELQRISGMTGAAWCHGLGISQATLSKYRSGERPVTPEKKRRAVELAALGVLIAGQHIHFDDIARMGAYRYAEADARGELDFSPLDGE